ncbi:type II secretion system F family protein [Desulfonatronum sp. SC1]|uniref:type II secretion system F family protein n=1 Tax=Desulfonatronum sp. SC1 TaxID=2109626 RepID=UPI000D306BB9|nr:type II secretion system F family protein [Desulfonatronum sp. SC1]PTN34330.1 type II secretion system F family protein [Desulfonatronum sp. SC1]
MPTFHYVALDRRGEQRKGLCEAESRAAAYARLQEQGMLPIRLGNAGHAQGRTLRGLLSPGSWHRRIRLDESFYSLGMMIQGGGSLAQSLDLLARMSSGASARFWVRIRDAVEGGQAFSQALRDHPDVVSPVYAAMIHVAEQVGRLGEVLERIARYEEGRRDFREKLLTSLGYPLTILIIGLGAVFFLLSRVLPRIADIVTASAGELSWDTRLLLNLGSWMESWGGLLLLGLIGMVFLGVTTYKRRPSWRIRLDRLIWRLPVVQKGVLARFSGLVSFQIQAGIPLVQALQSSAQGVGSLFFREKMLQAAREVSTGQPLDGVLWKQGIYPDVFLTAISAGRAAGKLGPFLERLGKLLERETDASLKRFAALIEPALILGLGLLVGFLVLAVMGPIFDLTSRVG